MAGWQQAGAVAAPGMLLALGLLALVAHLGTDRMPGVLLQSRAAHGATQVADQSLASSILHSARRKFQAKKSIAKRHAAHRAAATSLDGFHLDKKARAALAGKKAVDGDAPTSSLLTRMPVANSAKGVIAAASYLNSQKKGAKKGTKRRSKAAQLEYDIAHHKLTTRGLVAAVKEVQQYQEKQLDSSLKDQTDDLIIAKINQLRGAKAHQSSTQSYVLKNALTPGEQATLSNKKSYTPGGARARGGGGGLAPPQLQRRWWRRVDGGEFSEAIALSSMPQPEPRAATPRECSAPMTGNCWRAVPRA